MALNVGGHRPVRFRFSQTGEHQWNTLLRSAVATEELGMAIGQELQGGEVITLTGELGAGKTCCVRGLAQGLGVSSHEVTSPTFTIIQEYEGHPPIVHVDLYRLESSFEVEEIGLSSYFDSEHVVIIEWADRVLTAQLPTDRLALQLTHGSRHSRHAQLQAFGPHSQALAKNVIFKANNASNSR